MIDVEKLLERARRAATIRNVGEPSDPRPVLEEALRALVSELAAESEKAERRKRPFGEITPNLELYVQAGMNLLHEAERRGREDASRELVLLARTEDDVAPECGCLCRAHGRSACRACVAVERCERHSSE